MNEGENYARFAASPQGRPAFPDGQPFQPAPPGQQLPQAPYIRQEQPMSFSQGRPMVPIPEELGYNAQAGYQHQVSQGSYSGGTMAHQTSVTRTMLSKKKSPALQRTELSHYKVENFRPLADQNFDLASAKVIPLDDVSVEEAQPYHGEIKTINLQPIEVRQTVLPAKTLVDRSIQLSEKSIADDVHIEEKPIETATRQAEPRHVPEERVAAPQPVQPTFVQAPTPVPQRIIVKDMVKRQTPVEVDSIHECADKGLDWRSCCGILAALIFIIGMAALLKYFLFAPVIVPAAPAPVVVAAVEPVPVPAPVPVILPPAPNATVVEQVVEKPAPVVTRIEHIKIRQRTHGKSLSSHHVLSHNSATGKTTHRVRHGVVREHNNHLRVPPLNHSPAPSSGMPPGGIQGPLIQENRIFVTPGQPGLQGYEVQPALIGNWAPQPPQASYISIDPGYEPSQYAIQQPFDQQLMQAPSVVYTQQPETQFVGDLGDIGELAPLGDIGDQIQMPTAQQALFVGGNAQGAVFSNGGQAGAADSQVPNLAQNGIQYLSESTVVNGPQLQPILQMVPTQPAGNIQIELEEVPEAPSHKVTVHQKPVDVTTEHSVNVSSNSAAVSSSETHSVVNQSEAANLENKITVGSPASNIHIPHTVVFPDDTVLHKVVAIDPFTRRRNLKQTKKADSRIRHDFDELSNSPQPSAKSPNDVLNSVVRGDRSYEPYRHMKDFMSFFQGVEDKNNNDDFGITYKFRNAGTALGEAASRKGEKVLVDAKKPRIVIFAKLGKKIGRK